MTDYLSKRALFPPLIDIPPADNLSIIVVIPCYNETQILRSLESLAACEDIDGTVEVIILINDSQKDTPEVRARNQSALEAITAWQAQQSATTLRFYPVYLELPLRKAGVGLARKAGMDEAVRRFRAVGQQATGIIACFDADSLCQPNYFKALQSYFNQYPVREAVSIHYEHPLTGEDYSSEIYEAIGAYELHLRYYTLAKRYATYPHAFETIGSAMAVRCSAYEKQGGMNTRKAGEDFYFLNKFMLVGTLGELNSTTIIPSPRISDRVPFGTGKAVGDALEQGGERLTYHFQSFRDLKQLLENVPDWYLLDRATLEASIDQLPLVVQQFLEGQAVINKILEIQQHTGSQVQFQKRWFQWFDPFMVMKFAHYLRDHAYPDVPVIVAVEDLLSSLEIVEKPRRVARDQLLFLRQYWERD